MDIERFKRLSTPKIEAGRITEVVRDVIKEVRTNKQNRELKIETFSGRRRQDWQSKPGTEVAVASRQNSNIKIAVNTQKDGAFEDYR